jgi:hypothetical protein
MVLNLNQNLHSDLCDTRNLGTKSHSVNRYKRFPCAPLYIKVVELCTDCKYRLEILTELTIVLCNQLFISSYLFTRIIIHVIACLTVLLTHLVIQLLFLNNA